MNTKTQTPNLVLPTVMGASFPVVSGQVDTASIVNTSTTVVPRQYTDSVQRPSWMSVEQADQIVAAVASFMEVIRSEPTNARIMNDVKSIGQQSRSVMEPAMTLYNMKMNDALGTVLTEDGGQVHTSLLQVKQELDKVNPSVLKDQKVPYRWIGWLFPLIGRLPLGEEVLAKIYASRETVASTVSGIRIGLFAERDKIQTLLGELETIYENLLVGDRQDQADTYFGELLLREVDAFRVSLTERTEVLNMEEFQGALQRRVNFVKERRLVSQQFFEGVVAFQRNARMQIENLELYGSLEQAILASLGLKAASKALAQSAKLTKMLGQAIGDTLADTATEQRKVGEQLMDSQKNGLIPFEKIEAACNEYDILFGKIEAHNRELITVGKQTGDRLKGLLAKSEERVERHHASVTKQQGVKQ